MIEYLRKNRGFYNISAIEVACKIPKGLLRNVLNSGKNMPDKYIPFIEELFVGLGYSSKDNAASKSVKEASKKVARGDYIPLTMDYRHLMRGRYTNGEETIVPERVDGKLCFPRGHVVYEK